MWVSKRARPTPRYVLAWIDRDVTVFDPRTGIVRRLSVSTFKRLYRPSDDYVAARKYVNS